MISQNNVIPATVLQMTVQRALHNSQAFWLICVPMFFSNFREETAKNLIQLIARDTFHSLKSFSHIFVLLEVFWFWFLPVRFAGSSCSVGNLSFAVFSLKRSREIEEFGKSALLNSAIVQQQEKQQHNFLFTALMQCFKLIGYFRYLLYFLGFDWLIQAVLFFLNWTVCHFQ